MTKPDESSVSLPETAKDYGRSPGFTPTEKLKPYANEGLRLTTAVGAQDLTPPAGAEFTINFPGGFLFVTHEGCVLGLNPLARHEAVKAWADPKLDRLITDFGNTEIAPVPDAIYERLKARSLAWHPKGAYVLATRWGGRLEIRQDVDDGTCVVKHCGEKAAGNHPHIPPNTVLVKLCRHHREEVRRDPECQFCPDKPAVVDLQPTVDGITLDQWDPMCLSCAEKSCAHWRKNGVTWERRSIPAKEAPRAQ